MITTKTKVADTLPLCVEDRLLKRAFDLFASALGLICLGWLIAFAYVIAMVDTRESGFFTQERIGKNGQRFKVFKIRTMRSDLPLQTTVTSADDPRITKFGRLFRQTKIDELPQLFNVLRGDMSFVGPRPDVPGFADQLSGDDRVILSIRPGITGPASLHFKDEEKLLSKQKDPEAYNRTVIYPEKIRLNREYVQNYSFRKDIEYILQTLGLARGSD